MSSLHVVGVFFYNFWGSLTYTYQMWSLRPPPHLFVKGSTTQRLTSVSSLALESLIHAVMSHNVYCANHSNRGQAMLYISSYIPTPYIALTSVQYHYVITLVTVTTSKTEFRYFYTDRYIYILFFQTIMCKWLHSGAQG